MEKFKILDFSQQKIRTMHYTWIAFFLTFFVWFNMAPLATTMLSTIEWLTKDHIKILAISNVALTIPARIVVGSLIDKYGPKRVFSGLMIITAIPVFFFAFGNTFIQLLVSRLLLGTIGAGFVIGCGHSRKRGGGNNILNSNIPHSAVSIGKIFCYTPTTY